MSLFQTILVPTDFSDVSRKALKTAAALNGKTPPALLALHVLDVRIFKMMRSLDVPSVHAIQAKAEKEARQELDRFLSSSDLPAGADVQPIVEIGIPFLKITELAERRKADLILVGATGKSGFQELVSGSLTQKLLKMAPCSIMVVKT